MSKPIEPGVRAYFAWWPDPGPGTEHCRCTYGYVKDGPFPPGYYWLSDGSWVWNNTNKWNVRTDEGDGFALCEEYIYPVDDGDEDDATQGEDRRTTEDLPVGAPVHE